MTPSSFVSLTFLPSRISENFSPGISVLDAVRKVGLSLPAFCGGNGVCGRCKVQIQGITHSPTQEDLHCLSADEIQQGYRLACTCVVESDGTVILPESDQAAETEILSEGATRLVSLAPSVRQVPITLAPPSLGQNISDEELMLTALNSFAAQIRMSPWLLPALAERLRLQSFTGTAILVDDEMVDFVVTPKAPLFGVAVDLGTTTIVSKLIDLTTGKKVATTARLNGQRSFGEDVIGRISYAMRGAEETKQLQRAVLDLLNESIREMCEGHHIDPQQIYQIVIAGNTVMEHLLLGLNGKYLAQMPYVPTFRQAQKRRGQDLGLIIHPAAQVYLLPIIGRFVGGDTSAVLLSLADKQNGLWLAVDIGTNGEMILAKNGEFFSTSAAAGPAFEGAHIEQGMRAGVGAVDRVSFHHGQWDVHVIGDGPAKGICGSGLIDAIGALVQIRGLDMTGRLQKNDHLPICEEGGNNTVVRFQGSSGGEITLSQKDIREVQLAKSAIATAIEILLKSAGVSPDQLDALYLAGAFGQYIRKDMALAIGLLPSVPIEKIHFIGNAAYVGAELALLSEVEGRRVEKLARQVRYVEVASDPEFQNRFSENLFFPDVDAMHDPLSF